MTPINTPELRERTAAALRSAAPSSHHFSAFVGFDGFVDEILDVVDTRQDVSKYDRMPTIASFAERLAAAAGKSTNVELVTKRTKIGGNGPIMANALSCFGLKLAYVGSLGYPTLHPVFMDFAMRASIVSIANPGHTDALEFDDGKLLMGKLFPLDEVNWENLIERYGKQSLQQQLQTCHLSAFVNWTMLPHMSTIWEKLLAEVVPMIMGPRRWMFFDLADPAKRTNEDVLYALQLIHRFNERFNVILGLNEKEAMELGEALELPPTDGSPEGLAKLSLAIAEKVKVETLVVHPVKYALAVSNGHVSMVAGPTVTKPLITTGAGDHFNGGFCFGKLLGLDDEASLLTGVTTSGYYVRTAKTPGVLDLAGMMEVWPT